MTIKESDIIKINELKKQGLTYTEIAKEVGCGKSTVFMYLKEENKFLYKNETYKQKRRRKSKHVIDWKKQKKILLVEYKGGKCEQCGYNKCIEALEFHHKNPNEKDFSISSHSYSFDRMKKEVDKCILVCANCHREIHYYKK